MKLKNEFLKKKLLIYGLGKSGISALKYLNKKNKCYVFDDNKKEITKKYKKFFITKSKLELNKFDNIIISPGINFKKCLLSNYLIKNRNKIITDLDVFYKFNPKILTVTITGTNGKSTTCKLLYNILKDQRFDVRLVGNIGNPILDEKKIQKKTIFVVEASSYQLAYSKYFRSNFSLIINIAADHLERHLNMNRYIASKIKCVTMQNENDISIISNNGLIKKVLKTKNIKSKIIFLKNNNYLNLKYKIKNNYFKNSINFQNIKFIFELSKYLKLNKKKFYKTIDNFKPLEFRQQLIHNSEILKIINDSKSTTLSSTTPFLKSKEKIYWILGGLFKKGDKFDLDSKYFKNIKAFVYGKDRKKFVKILKNKLSYNLSKNLSEIIKIISKDIKSEKKKVVLLFSPAAASFDQFKNFEDRGKKFNELIYKYFIKR